MMTYTMRRLHYFKDLICLISLTGFIFISFLYIDLYERFRTQNDIILRQEKDLRIL
jgi:hypothetical protein